MYDNGKRIKYIASQFNVSVKAVYNWVKCKNNLENLLKDNKALEENLNIQEKPIKLKIDENHRSLKLNKQLEAVEMYLHGIKMKDIAAQFNVCVGTIYQWVKSKDDLMKKKNDLNMKMIIEAPEYQLQFKNKIRKL